MTTTQNHHGYANQSGNIGFFIEECNPDCVISYMAAIPGIFSPSDTIRANAMLWLACVTASILAIGGQTIEDDEKGFPLTINVHTVIVSTQKSGDIRAEARLVRRGQNVVVISTRITGDGDKLLAEITTTHLKAQRVQKWEI